MAKVVRTSNIKVDTLQGSLVRLVCFTSTYIINRPLWQKFTRIITQQHRHMIIPSNQTIFTSSWSLLQQLCFSSSPRAHNSHHVPICSHSRDDPPLKPIVLAFLAILSWFTVGTTCWWLPFHSSGWKHCQYHSCKNIRSQNISAT